MALCGFVSWWRGFFGALLARRQGDVASKLREKLEGMTAREIGGELLLRAQKKLVRVFRARP